jgi:hypothetical protein
MLVMHSRTETTSTDRADVRPQEISVHRYCRSLRQSKRRRQTAARSTMLARYWVHAGKYHLSEPCASLRLYNVRGPQAKRRKWRDCRYRTHPSGARSHPPNMVSSFQRKDLQQYEIPCFRKRPIRPGHRNPFYFQISAFLATQPWRWHETALR